MKHLHLGDWHFYYLEVDGRLSQAQFWQGFLPILVLVLLLNACSTYLPGELFAVLFLLTLFPTIILLIKRSHDIGLSGNYCWLLAVPILNVFVLLTLLLLWGTPGENRFGADPKAGGHHLWSWQQQMSRGE